MSIASTSRRTRRSSGASSRCWCREPTVEDTIAILRGLKESYEVHHGIRIQDAALVAAAALSNRYITERFLPDKAIDLVDEAASKIKMEIDSMPRRDRSGRAPLDAAPDRRASAEARARSGVESAARRAHARGVRAHRTARHRCARSGCARKTLIKQLRELQRRIEDLRSEEERAQSRSRSRQGRRDPIRSRSPRPKRCSRPSAKTRPRCKRRSAI